MRVIVAGAGPGALDLYTQRTLEAVKTADIVLTSARLIQGLEGCNDKVKILGVMETVSFINENQDKNITVCVIASGDTGFYSIANTVAERINQGIELEFLSGIGSLQYFAAKIKLGYESMKLVSLHGKEKSIVPYVCYNEKVFTLTGGTIKAQDIIKSLIQAGMEHVTLYVGEKLSMKEERIVSGSPKDLADFIFDDLTVIVVHNNNYVNQYKTLRDDDFIRGKRPMTKEAVRNLAVASLEIEPSDVVYDIGAGTGSVTCAMALKAVDSMVYAIEKEEDGIGLLKENMNHLGIYNIKPICGTAPEDIVDFPTADKVFIGGSTGKMKEIIEIVLEKNQQAVFVITAVTLETISQVTTIFNDLDVHSEITCANISTAQKLGRYNLMKAENPVYIIRGVKNIEK